MLRKNWRRTVEAGLLINVCFVGCQGPAVQQPTVLTASGISPAFGAAKGGTAVTITGKNFTDTVTVKIGDSVCNNVVVPNAETLYCTTTSHPSGTADVELQRDAERASIVNAFLFQDAPSIIALTPTSGTLGTQVTISGASFYPNARVLFDGVEAANVVVSSPASVTCTAPAHADGAVTVVLRNRDGQEAAVVSGFTYATTPPPPPPAPVVSSVAPATGSSLGGTTITVTGTGFQSGATVSLLSSGCSTATCVANCGSVTVASSGTSLTCVTSAHAAGVVNVRVRNPDMQSDVGEGLFTYVAPEPAPTISSISPTAVRTGSATAVTITGTQFSVNATVTVGGVPCASLTRNSATQLTCVVPDKVVGAVSFDDDIVVTHPDAQQATLANALTYYRSGALDHRFGIDGRVDNVSSGYDMFRKVLVTPAGIVVAGAKGSTAVNGRDFLVARYDGAGMPDASFGNAGVRTVDFNGNWDEGTDVALDADGSLVVGGYASGPVAASGTDFGFLRLSGPSGAVLATGRQSWYAGNDFGLALAIAPSGQVVVAGHYDFVLNDVVYPNTVVARFTPDFEYDISFAGGVGGVETDLSLAYSESLSSVHVEADGSIVAVGYTEGSAQFNFQTALLKWTSAGEPDAAFGTTGQTVLPLGGIASFGFASAPSGDSLYVVGPAYTAGSQYQFSTASFSMQTGQLQSAFSGDGVDVHALGFVGADYFNYARAVALQADGRIVVAGNAMVDVDGNEDLAVVRYLSNGTIDTSFGTMGEVFANVGGSRDHCESLAIQPNDGKIICAGWTGSCDFTQSLVGCTDADAFVIRMWP